MVSLRGVGGWEEWGVVGGGVGALCASAERNGFVEEHKYPGQIRNKIKNQQRSCWSDQSVPKL